MLTVTVQRHSCEEYGAFVSGETCAVTVTACRAAEGLGVMVRMVDVGLSKTVSVKVLEVLVAKVASPL